MQVKIMTIKEAINLGKEKLKATPFGRLEAEVVLAYILKKTRTYLHININEEVSPSDKESFLKEIEAFKNGRPLQYIVGMEEWQGLKFFCDKNTLIPREDTRILLEETERLIARFKGRVVVIEIGTGSGILATLLKKNNPNIDMYVVEKNPKTFKVAERNFDKHNVEINGFVGDLLKPIKKNNVKADILISNPPYISLRDYRKLDIWVKNEPYEALIGGLDGLDFYRRIAGSYKPVLKEGGYVVVEIGFNQFLAVKNIFKEKGLTFFAGGVDDCGRDRVIIMRYGK